MRWIVNSKEMKECDSNTIGHFGVPSLVLMERAALCVTEQVLRAVPRLRTALIVCGNGNNGADGLAAARMLHLKGCRVTVVQKPEPGKCSAENQLQRDILDRYGIHIIGQIPQHTAYDCVVDALFGIGLSREPKGIYAQWLGQMNELCAYKVAVDMPSGVSSDNGAAYDPCFAADLTVTFAYQKAGQILYPGCEKCGTVAVADIGITKESWLDTKPSCFAPEPADLKLLPQRPGRSNKGTFGRVLAVAGSENMAGAALFCARAAYHTGCGLVKIYTCAANRTILQTALPEAILATFQDAREDTAQLSALQGSMECDVQPSALQGPMECDAHLSADTAAAEDAAQALADAVKWADAIVLGPGIGQSMQARRMVSQVLQEATVPVVLDADALNLIAGQPDLLEQAAAELVVTPHPGEMARLCQKPVAEILDTVQETAEAFAKRYHLTCVLKDAVTVTAGPSGTCLNTSGCSAMAKGGSGDVLAGMIASLAAQGMQPEAAARMGVYLHGLAGEDAAGRKGARSVSATDLIEAIGNVMGG